MGSHGKSSRDRDRYAKQKKRRDESESESDSYSSDSDGSSPPRSSRRRKGSSRSSSRRRYHSSDDSSDSDGGRKSKKRTSSRKPSEEEIKEYIARKAQKKALRAAKKLKTQSVSGYSNDSNPFGDSNLTEAFVWRKKIEKDVHHGVPLEEFSVKAEKRRRGERMTEVEKVKKRREERAVEKARHEEEMALLARERARAEFQDWEKKEEEFHFDQSKEDKKLLELKRMVVLEKQKKRIKEAMVSKPPPVEDNLEFKAMKAMGEMEEGDAVFGSKAEVNLDSEVYWWHDKYRPRKPKYFNRVHTGYEWNKYNQTHYDHDNPPPKTVQGYKFNIFYPDLVDKIKAPTFTIEKDGTSSETCMIRFHAGPPYEDIAFRIVNKEWEYSHKKGFKCTFERGILHLYFNFKRHRYRR
ncbi:hypothetical protein BRARA_J00220 [Brassica rapa]|uniref:Splicing factor Cactin C-terminal domain-containing protein n=1 Tax=Brassica campestris TaxID=3711 RepID=A0A397XP12_BRACM|nr:hypothetical protein BRARA_J00220 [Brassica rapa]